MEKGFGRVLAVVGGKSGKVIHSMVSYLSKWKDQLIKKRAKNSFIFSLTFWGPMQFYIAVYIDGELNKLLDFNLLPLLISESWKRKLLHLAVYNPHSVVLGHTTVLKPERNQWAPSFVSFVVASDGSNPACTTGRLKNNLSRPMRNKRTKCPEGEISINVFLSFHRCKLDPTPSLACLRSVTLNWLEDQALSFDR